MSGIRLPLLCAFAGGCLSNAVMFGLWRAGESASDSEVKHQQRSHNVVELVTAARSAPSVAQANELAPATTADPEHEATTEAAFTPAAPDPEGATPAPAGSAVSDVLTRLETAYRERVAAPAQAAAAPEHPTAAAPADGPLAAPEAVASVPPQPVAEVIPAVAATEARAPAAQVAPAAFAPQGAPPAPPAPPAQIAALPAVAAQDIPPPPPTEVHYGDVNQNTYNITNVREGDVYLIQMQQVAMLQYLQLLGMSPGSVAPARRVAGAGHQRGTLSTGITNPDNPWGFHFAPPHLVR